MSRAYVLFQGGFNVLQPPVEPTTKLRHSCEFAASSTNPANDARGDVAPGSQLSTVAQRGRRRRPAQRLSRSLRFKFAVWGGFVRQGAKLIVQCVHVRLALVRDL